MKVVNGGEEAASWVASKIPHMYGAMFEKYSAFWILTDDNDLVAGIVFDEYQPEYKTIQIHFAQEKPVMNNKSIMKDMLDYPFNKLGVQKVWFATPHKNEKLIGIAKNYGFTQEAVLARHFGDHHAVIMRMFRKDYVRLYGQ